MTNREKTSSAYFRHSTLVVICSLVFQLFVRNPFGRIATKPPPHIPGTLTLAVVPGGLVWARNPGHSSPCHRVCFRPDFDQILHLNPLWSTNP